MSKGEAYLEVWCDKCGYSIYVQLTYTVHGWDDRDIDKSLIGLDWEVDGDNIICDGCKEEVEDENENRDD